MSNSKVVIERVLRDYECVVCGSREFDVKDVTESQTEDAVGNRFDECRKCGEMYPTNPNADSGKDAAGNVEADE